jgi:hypothetical protein
MSKMQMPDRTITEIYILIAVDKDGKEGIVQTMLPFLTSNKELALKFFEQVKHQPLPKGLSLKLTKFSNKEFIKTHSISND